MHPSTVNILAGKFLLSDQKCRSREFWGRSPSYLYAILYCFKSVTRWRHQQTDIRHTRRVLAVTSLHTSLF